jgi:hypothetical protein
VCRPHERRANKYIAGDTGGTFAALDEFNARWPKFRELRNLEEHIRGPSLDAPAGFTYFGDFVGDLLPGGTVDYVIDVRDTEVIDRLYESLCNLLAE